MREIGINLQIRPEICAIDFIKRAAQLGFNTLFTDTPCERHLHIIANALAANGMRYETIHAPFSRINDIWIAGEGGDTTLRDLMEAVDRCAAANVPIAVVHLSSGNNPPPISEVGFVRYTRLLEYAAAKGVKLERIIATGGGAKSPIWCQLQADITGLPVCIPAEKEAACLGAAMICGVSDGRFGDLPTAVAACVGMNAQYEPHPSPRLDRKYRRFNALYQAALEINNIK